MSQKKSAFLYIGGSYPQLTAVRQVKELGVSVILVDRNESVPGFELADEKIVASATDLNAIKAELTPLLANYQFSGGYGVADYAYKSLGPLFDERGFQCITNSTLETMLSKNLSLSAWKKVGVPCPQTLWQGAHLPTNEDLEKLASFKKIIIKAIDSNNSRGIYPLQNPSQEEISQTVSLALKESNFVIIENFIQGRVINADGVMIKGEYYPCSTSIRTNRDDLEHMTLSMQQPAPLSNEKLIELQQIAKKAALAVGYHFGPFTIDVMEDETGFYVLEISPHFHNITNEWVREQSRPLAAWVSFLKGQGDWKSFIKTEQREMKSRCYELRYNGKSNKLNTLEELRKLSSAPEISDFHIYQSPHSIIKKLDLVGVFWISSSNESLINEVSRALERSIAE